MVAWCWKIILQLFSASELSLLLPRPWFQLARYDSAGGAYNPEVLGVISAAAIISRCVKCKQKRGATAELRVQVLEGHAVNKNQLKQDGNNSGGKIIPHCGTSHWPWIHWLHFVSVHRGHANGGGTVLHVHLHKCIFTGTLPFWRLNPHISRHIWDFHNERGFPPSYSTGSDVSPLDTLHGITGSDV